MMKLFYNGKIYDENLNLNNVMVVENNKIVYIGNENLIIPEKHEKIDLKKAYVLPGFIDSHIHLYQYSKSLFEIDLSNLNSLKDVLNRLKEFKTREKIIFGFGWDDEKWETKPDKKYLDDIFPDKYVILKRRDGHSIWVNTKVLNEIDLNLFDSSKGAKIEKNLDGYPNGILREKIVDYVLEKFREKEDLDLIIKEGVRKLNSFGITSICNMDGHILPYLMNRKFNLRIINSIPKDKVQDFVSVGIKSDFGNDFLRIGGLKIFFDGSLGSKTALMKEGYIDEKNNFGISYLDEKELDEIVDFANSNGIYVWIHAIGDLANDIVLKVLSKEKRNKNNRIEHAQILSDYFVKNLRKINLFLSVQPSHIFLDIEKIEKYLGKRGRLTYPFKTLINNGGILCFGSDAPIEEPDPLKGLKVSVLRRVGEKEFYKEESLGIKEAFYCYTLNPARSVNMDDKIGTISVGKFADFVTFSDDPLSFKGKILNVYFDSEKIF